jgi:RimJ/RimL family protein N-acetyltransferase
VLVSSGVDWPRAGLIETARLTLEPLHVDHAEEIAPVLDDASLHDYIGGQPESAEQLRIRYARLVAGQSPDGQQGWLNWVIRYRDTGAIVGTVQATLHQTSGQRSAEIAWIIASGYQGQGHAKEATSSMVSWLREHGVRVFIAHVHPRHVASIAVARHLGLTATDVSIDGETRWTAAEPS